MIPASTSNRLSYHDHQHEPARTVVPETARTCTTVDKEPPAIPAVVSPPPLKRASLASHKKRDYSMFGGLLTWQTLEHDRDDPHDELDSRPDSWMAIALRLPLTSYRMDFSYVSMMGTPSYALNITHIIEQNSSLYNLVRTIMLHDRSLPGLQILLSERRISIYSKCGDMNLFYVSNSKSDIFSPYL